MKAQGQGCYLGVCTLAGVVSDARNQDSARYLIQVHGESDSRAQVFGGYPMVGVVNLMTVQAVSR